MQESSACKGGRFFFSCQGVTPGGILAKRAIMWREPAITAKSEREMTFYGGLRQIQEMSQICNRPRGEWYDFLKMGGNCRLLSKIVADG
ncbi:hypothetical protein [Gellertiella hungarica]|uniref:Uncharacterized protein n=1 Tax=Gellertiella hungarica TaxID=1572859 RepID=A0A7W6J569_9HYPH|nr:hypothetical protein [Gellertiella hungarica]MBB4064995.1 hypothetical protein [Gellertiella hungarica]